MNLRDFARKHEAFDGVVTFWMLEFINRDAEIAYDELNRATPELLWRHRGSGEETYDDPYANPELDPVIEAQRKAGEWQEVKLWSSSHYTFVNCDPLTVDIEFKGKKLSAELRALKTYWENRNGNHLHNWEAFRQLISTQVTVEWYTAFAQTRDTSFDGPEALQSEPDEDTDPNA